MKTFLTLWIIAILISVGFLSYMYGSSHAYNVSANIMSETYSCHTNEMANLEKQCQKIAEDIVDRVDQEWSVKYNNMLKRLHDLESNMDELDVWTGDEIVVNHKNGTVVRFIVNENTIIRTP